MLAIVREIAKVDRTTQWGTALQMFQVSPGAIMDCPDCSSRSLRCRIVPVEGEREYWMHCASCTAVEYSSIPEEDQ